MESLLGNPMLLLIMVLILFGGQIKIGDQTLLQLIVSVLGGLFKPTTPPASSGGEPAGSILTTITSLFSGLLSNPMVLIVGLLAFTMLTGGSCGKKTAADPPPPAISVPVTPALFQPPASIDPRITLCGAPASAPWALAPDQLPIGPDDWTLGANLGAIVPLPIACQPCERARPPQPAAGAASAAPPRSGFWQRGPVRRLVASRHPLRRAVCGVRGIRRGLGLFCGR